MSRVVSARAWLVRWVIVHLLQQGFEIGEALAPEDSVETKPVDQRRQPAPLAAIVDLPPVPTFTQQAGLLQSAYMLGDRRLRDGVGLGERTHGQLTPLADLLHPPPPRRFAAPPHH